MNEEYIRVPYGSTVHGEEEIKAVVEVLNTTTQMSLNTEKFELEVSSLFNKEYGLMVNSGSSANLLAFEIMNLPENSEVITPILTFSTTLSPIVKKNLIPVFVDVEPETYIVNIDEIENRAKKLVDGYRLDLKKFTQKLKSISPKKVFVYDLKYL